MTFAKELAREYINKWIKDRCILDRKATTNATELYKDFAEYNTQEYISQTLFGSALKDLLVKYMKNGKVYYRGIKIDQ